MRFPPFLPFLMREPNFTKICFAFYMFWETKVNGYGEKYNEKASCFPEKRKNRSFLHRYRLHSRAVNYRHITH